jgi:hypothetical protein
MMSSTTTTTSSCLDSAVDYAVLAEWWHASAAVRDAYGQWRALPAPTTRAHAGYLAGVDQDAAAANDYADLIGRVTVLVTRSS